MRSNINWHFSCSTPYTMLRRINKNLIQLKMFLSSLILLISLNTFSQMIKLTDLEQMEYLQKNIQRYNLYRGQIPMLIKIQIINQINEYNVLPFITKPLLTNHDIEKKILSNSFVLALAPMKLDQKKLNQLTQQSRTNHLTLVAFNNDTTLSGTDLLKSSETRFMILYFKEKITSENESYRKPKPAITSVCGLRG